MSRDEREVERLTPLLEPFRANAERYVAGGDRGDWPDDIPLEFGTVGDWRRLFALLAKERE